MLRLRSSHDHDLTRVQYDGLAVITFDLQYGNTFIMQHVYYSPRPLPSLLYTFIMKRGRCSQRPQQRPLFIIKVLCSVPSLASGRESCRIWRLRNTVAAFAANNGGKSRRPGPGVVTAEGSPYAPITSTSLPLSHRSRKAHTVAYGRVRSYATVAQPRASMFSLAPLPPPRMPPPRSMVRIPR